MRWLLLLGVLGLLIWKGGLLIPFILGKKLYDLFMGALILVLVIGFFVLVLSQGKRGRCLHCGNIVSFREEDDVCPHCFDNPRVANSCHPTPATTKVWNAVRYYSRYFVRR